MSVAHELLTSQQVAEAFKVSVASVNRWAREGDLASIRTPGGNFRFRRKDVEAFLNPPPREESA